MPRASGRLEEALDAFAQDHRADDFFTPLLRAIVLKRLGRPEEAVAELNRGLKAEPSITQALWRELFFYDDPSIVERDIADLASLGLPET